MYGVSNVYVDNATNVFDSINGSFGYGNAGLNA